MKLTEIDSLYIVGIKGVAMSHIAVIMLQMGKKVRGSDVKGTFITDPLLKKNNIQVDIEFDSLHIPSDCKVVIYAASHGGINNPQVIAAKKKGIPAIAQSEFFNILMKEFKTTIAVCGTHGKTTTASFLSYIMLSLGIPLGYLAGTPSFSSYTGGGLTGNDYFVIEADEYGISPPHDKTPKFHKLNPDHIICTNIDFDHPDVYKNIEETKRSFMTFFDNKKLYLCHDDPIIRSLLLEMPSDVSYQTFGFSEDSDMVITGISVSGIYTSFSLTHKGTSLGLFQTQLSGKKNISNIAGVVLILISLGFSVEKLRKPIKHFIGVKRRFEEVYHGYISLIDDYAHHPHEIESTIEGARMKFPGRRIIIIFQPHTYSRTESLKNEFIETLHKADIIYIAPIFASARENTQDFSVSGEALEKIARKEGYGNISACSSQKDILSCLQSEIKAGDVVFTMGAGDIYELKNDIIDIAKKKEAIG